MFDRMTVNPTLSSTARLAAPPVAETGGAGSAERGPAGVSGDNGQQLARWENP